MRELKECKAEVFRRSEKRIRQRKQNRNRIIACCIPLCLCIALLSVIYLPGMMLSSDKNNPAAGTDIAYGSNGTVGFVYTSVEIKNNTAPSGSSNKENDIKTVENIYNIIQSTFVTEEEQQSGAAVDQFTDTQKTESADKEENCSSFLPSGTITDATKGISYTITFKADDGTQMIYTLNGNKLINEATSDEVILTEERLAELKKALGMSIS